jgi:hypothetical protein
MTGPATTSVLWGCGDGPLGVLPCAQTLPKRPVVDLAPWVSSPFANGLHFTEGGESDVVALVVGVDDACGNPAVRGAVGTVVVDAIDLQAPALAETGGDGPLGVWFERRPLIADFDASGAIVAIHRIARVLTTGVHPFPHPAQASTWSGKPSVSARGAVPVQDGVDVDPLLRSTRATNVQVVSAARQNSPCVDGLSLGWEDQPTMLTTGLTEAAGEICAPDLSFGSARALAKGFASTKFKDRPLLEDGSNFHLKDYSSQEGGESVWL